MDGIDVFGMTHPGKVRRNNEDQFFIASLRKSMEVVQPLRHLPRRRGTVSGGTQDPAKASAAVRVRLQGRPAEPPWPAAAAR